MTGFLSSTGWSWFSHISFAPETEAPKSECIGCGENQEEREREVKASWLMGSLCRGVETAL